jgi:hypothetical protein
MTPAAPNGAPDPEPIGSATTAWVVVGVVALFMLAIILNHLFEST